MTHAEIVQKLREENKNNPVAHAVFIRFGLRRRARNCITVNSLYLTMVKDGFNYDKAQYTKFIEFLASLGLGELDKDRRGKVRGLVNIETTLQTIGMAACTEQNTKLKKYISRPTIRRHIKEMRAVVEKPIVIKESTQQQQPIMDLNLEININGQTARISVPVISLLDKLRSA